MDEPLSQENVVDDFKAVVAEETKENGEKQLVAMNRRCGGPESKLMIFSFIVMITGFTFSTPFSLVLTIPAYVLAHRKSGNSTSRRYRCFKYASIFLNVVTIALGIALAILFTMAYIYLYF